MSTNPRKFRIGIVGCGAISNAYLSTAPAFPIIEVAAVADLNMDAAKARGTQFNVPKVCTPDELIADPSIELVLNLTIPAAHAPVALAAIAAGKHTYCEKPLAAFRDDGKKVIDAAKAKGVRVGSAPDTFLGSAHQTARKAIDDGLIGRPVAFTAFMMGRGHESWHPNPEFYYKPGGGPMLDMGPYYLNALVNMLGPIKRIAGGASTAIPERTITHGDGKGGKGPKHGQKIAVETPDHIAGIVEFANGALGTIFTSFAVMHSPHPPITVFGTEGTLAVPDPNGFDGDVMFRGTSGEWTKLPVAHPTGYQRMAGVADMAHAIRSNRPHRAGGDLAFAVLDAMIGFIDSSASGQWRNVAPCARPAAVPATLPRGTYE